MTDSADYAAARFLINQAIDYAEKTACAAENLLKQRTYESPDFDALIQILKDNKRFIQDQTSTLMLIDDGRI